MGKAAFDPNAPFEAVDESLDSTQRAV